MHMSAESIKRRDSHQWINNIPKEQSSFYEYCFAQIHIQSRATLLITEVSCPHLHWYSVQKGRTLTGVKLTEHCPNQTNYSCKDLPQTSLKMAQTIACARCGRVVIIFGKQITIFLNSQFDFQRMAVLSTLLSRCAPLSKPLTSVVTQVTVLAMIISQLLC